MLKIIQIQHRRRRNRLAALHRNLHRVQIHKPSAKLAKRQPRIQRRAAIVAGLRHCGPVLLRAGEEQLARLGQADGGFARDGAADVHREEGVGRGFAGGVDCCDVGRRSPLEQALEVGARGGVLPAFGAEDGDAVGAGFEAVEGEAVVWADVGLAGGDDGVGGEVVELETC